MAKGKKVKHFHPHEIVIMADKPDLPKRLFWEYNYDKIDWDKAYAVVIERVMEWGIAEEWEEVIRFYGKDKIINTLKCESTYLPDFVIEKVCNYFNLKPEELRCYIRKQSRKGHWI